MERRLGRIVQRGKRVQVIRAARSHRNAVRSRGSVEPLLIAAVELHGVEMRLQRTQLSRGVEHAITLFVDAGDVAHLPGSSGRLLEFLAFIRVNVDMAEAIAFTGPEKTLAVVQKIDVPLQVDP